MNAHEVFYFRKSSQSRELTFNYFSPHFNIMLWIYAKRCFSCSFFGVSSWFWRKFNMTIESNGCFRLIIRVWMGKTWESGWNVFRILGVWGKWDGLCSWCVNDTLKGFGLRKSVDWISWIKFKFEVSNGKIFKFVLRLSLDLTVEFWIWIQIFNDFSLDF